ncbi:MAG TPA: GNAT family N-acetyltransferase [Polyangia bacterium]|nr:GNAT family N-acetyltransferase [Polyangia bacterium]
MIARDITLTDGTILHLRDIAPADRDELERGFEHLSAESRYRRFLGQISALSPWMLRYLTNVDGHDHVAIVATVPADEGPRGVGVGRFVRLHDDPSVAEVAITVTDDMQRKGVGTIIALALADEARRLGVEHFRGEVLVDNQPCRELLEDLGAQLNTAPDGTLSFDVSLEREAPVPGLRGAALISP